MPERIAMTPPDLNGHQVLWENKGSWDAGLWLPDTGGPAEDVLLDFSQSGPECLQDLQKKRSV